MTARRPRLLHLAAGLGIGLAVLLQGCSTQRGGAADAIARHDILGQLGQGQVRLECGLACAATWRLARPALSGLYRNGLWSDLGVEVVRIGFRLDLGYFYLARSAEALGHPGAADTYYRLALASPSHCDGMIFDSCDGTRVPEEARAALDRLAGRRSTP